MHQCLLVQTTASKGRGGTSSTRCLSNPRYVRVLARAGVVVFSATLSSSRASVLQKEHCLRAHLLSLWRFGIQQMAHCPGSLRAVAPVPSMQQAKLFHLVNQSRHMNTGVGRIIRLFWSNFRRNVGLILMRLGRSSARPKE